MTDWTINYASCIWLGLTFGGLAAAIQHQRPLFAFILITMLLKEIHLTVTWRK